MDRDRADAPRRLERRQQAIVDPLDGVEHLDARVGGEALAQPVRARGRVDDDSRPLRVESVPRHAAGPTIGR